MGLAIHCADSVEELEEIFQRVILQKHHENQEKRFQAWHAWNQEYRKSGFGNDDCYWTIGSNDPIPCDYEDNTAAAALTVELSTEQALEITQDYQVPNPAYFQGLENQIQDVLTEASEICHDLKPKENKDLDRKPKSSTRYLLDHARNNPEWGLAAWNGYNLPGQGYSLLSCKKWMIKGCLNNTQHEENRVYVQTIQKECCRSQCPLCVEAWANRIANRMTKRLVTWAKMSRQNASHVMISLPESMHNQDTTEIKKIVKWVKNQVGITGSADILHPFRFEESKGIPYVSPHMHMLAFGWIDGSKVAEVYRKTGIFVKKIRTIKKEGEYFATSKYLLTHAGVRPGTHAVVYTGRVSYSKLHLEKEETESPKCPYCDLELQNLRIMSRGLDRPPDFELGFAGLTDYPYLEIVKYHDQQHYYDESWNVTTSEDLREERRERQAKEAPIRIMQERERKEAERVRVATKQEIARKSRQNRRLC